MCTEKLTNMQSIRKQKAGAPQVKSVMRSFDKQFDKELHEAKENLRTWIDVLGSGDEHVLSFGKALMSPRSFHSQFQPLANARVSKLRDGLKSINTEKAAAEAEAAKLKAAMDLTQQSGGMVPVEGGEPNVMDTESMKKLEEERFQKANEETKYNTGDVEYNAIHLNKLLYALVYVNTDTDPWATKIAAEFQAGTETGKALGLRKDYVDYKAEQNRFSMEAKDQLAFEYTQKEFG